jgi:imidazolonepropionase-like amidohydrolase/Tol biopolymer transport system component
MRPGKRPRGPVLPLSCEGWICLRRSAAALAVAGAGACAAPHPQAPPSPSGVGIDTLEVTVDQATNLSLDVSPDGSSIVFTLFHRLWLLPAEGGEARALTGAGEYAASARAGAWPIPGMPAWSPDGEWVAFVTPQGLSMVHAGSGERRRLTCDQDDEQPRWVSAERLSFATRRAWPEDRRGWPVGDMELWTLDLPSAAQQAVSPRFETITGHAWSPDGSAIGVAGTPAGGEPGVWLVDPERRSLLGRLVDGPGFGALAWSTDDRLLAVRRSDHDSHIMVLTLTGHGQAVRTEAAETLRGGADMHSVAWEPDGGILHGADGRIWRYVDGAREPVPFRASVPVQRPRYDRRTPALGAGTGNRAVTVAVAPAISPDGERIAFSALGELWVMGPDGDASPLTSATPFPPDLAWSPNGQQIAFAAPAGDRYAIWVIGAEGTDLRRLTDLPGNQLQPRWSADGRRIAFYCAGPCAPGVGSVIGWVSADGATTRLVHAERREWMVLAGWTGDGEQIVFHGRKPYGADHPERPGGPERVVPWGGRLWAVPADSGAAVPWGPVAPMRHPVLTTSGDAVLYQAAGALWRVPAGADGVPEGSRPERLAAELADWPSASADGRQVVYFAPEGLTRLDALTGQVERLRIPLHYTLRRPPPLVVTTVRLFDGTGAAPGEPVDIWIADGRIERIVPSGAGAQPAEVMVLDGGGAFALPGLIDGHVHPYPATMPLDLRAGVTTAREAGGGSLPTMISMRETIEAGRLPGPRLLVAGETLGGGTSPTGTPSVTSPEEARPYVARAARLGADLVKLYDMALPVEALVRASHEAGLPVISHGEGALVGLDGKEHAFGTRFYDDWVELHARGGLALGPTMVTIMDIDAYASPDLERISVFARDALDVVRRAHEAGGQIIAGSDHGSMHRELELLVFAGLTPAAALHAATGGAARILGIDELVGTIQPGKLADLIILEPGADPLRDIRDTRRIRNVIQGGGVVDRAGLLEWARENQQSGGQR